MWKIQVNKCDCQFFVQVVKTFGLIINDNILLHLNIFDIVVVINFQMVVCKYPDGYICIVAIGEI